MISKIRILNTKDVQQISTLTSNVNIYGYHIYNPNAYDVFVKFYDKETSPVIGTDNLLWYLHINALGSVFLDKDKSFLTTSNKAWVVVTTAYTQSDTNFPATGLDIQLTVSDQYFT